VRMRRYASGRPYASLCRPGGSGRAPWSLPSIDVLASGEEDCAPNWANYPARGTPPALVRA